MHPIRPTLALFITVNVHAPAIAFVAGDFIYTGAGDLLGPLVVVALNFLGQSDSLVPILALRT